MISYLNSFNWDYLLVRIVYSILTLYMMAILLRWFAPWVEIDLHAPRLRWIRIITDPLLNRIRRMLPPLGPMDFGPVLALFLIWLVRQFSIFVLTATARSSGLS